MHLQQTINFWSGSVIHHNTSSSTASTNTYGCMKFLHSLPLSVFRTQCVCLRHYSPIWAQAASFFTLLHHTQLDTHTHTHTHPVGLLSTKNQLVTEAATYTTANKPNSGIRTHDPSNQGAADQRLRPARSSESKLSLQLYFLNHVLTSFCHAFI
jgi:hypothetical protein